jgi:hypothetical protein
MFTRIKNWFARVFLGRTFEFLSYDNEREIHLDCIRCVTCSNTFYVENAEQEIPNRCPFCPAVFSRVDVVSNAAMREAQDSSH